MATVESKIITALTDYVDGHIWPLSKPAEENPDTFIVFKPELLAPEDYGDDEDLEWLAYMQIHWYAKGHADPNPAKRAICTALKRAGFTIESIPVSEYESENGSSAQGIQTGWTHVCILANIPEDEAYGEYDD